MLLGSSALAHVRLPDESGPTNQVLLTDLSLDVSKWLPV